MGMDSLLIMVSLQLAAYLRPRMDFLNFAQPFPQQLPIPVPLFPIFSLIWVFVLLLFTVYDGRKNLKIVDEFTSLTSGVTLAAITSAGALFLSFRDISRLLFVLFVLIAYFGLLSWRAIYRLLIRWKGFPTPTRKVLVVGAGEVGQSLMSTISENSHFGLSFVGFLDDQGDHPHVMGYLDDARKIVSDQGIDDVVFALPGWAYDRVNALVAELHDLPVRVWVIPDYFSLALHHAGIEEYAGIPMLDLRAPALNDYQRLIKRAFDLAVTLLLIIPASLVMFLVAAAVRIGSPGPVIFRQKRVGENGRPFEMLKFRSMRETNLQDSAPDAPHKSPSDPRITPLGHFLRRTSLDELPQLINVLRGEMSLVGPRPELPSLVENYELWQRTRFAVPPGVTGWWQITGRSDKPMHLHTEDDLYYVKNYSLALDISILLRTIWVVIRGKGAY